MTHALFDTHCHLDLPVFDADRQQVLAQCRRNGVERILLPGVTVEGWTRIRDLARSETTCLPAYGLHPMLCTEHPADAVEQLRGMIQAHRPVAIGEIGLDFYEDRATADLQTALFLKQLALAAEFDLPVVLHVRKAHDQVLGYLRRHSGLGGIVHAFGGSLDQARQYAELGFVVGLGGMVTHPHSRRLRELCTALEGEWFVLETDAPDLTPAKHRGERNSPAYLPEILAVVAALRGVPEREVAELTTRNAVRVLRQNGAFLQ